MTIEQTKHVADLHRRLEMCDDTLYKIKDRCDEDLILRTDRGVDIAIVVTQEFKDKIYDVVKTEVTRIRQEIIKELENY